MAGHFGQAFFLLALTSFLAWRASGAASLLVVTGVALTVTCGLSENVYPFALMAPALFLRDAPRLRSALEAEPRSASAAPPGTPCPYVWEFDDAIASGAGWEEHVEGRSELWSVARRATLNLHLDTRHDHRVRIVIAYALSSATLASLRVEVNGEPVTLRHRAPPHAGEFVGTIPREIVALDPDITELAFLVDGLDVPAPPSPDRRSLGLLFDRLEITPAGS
jgi:hypothetical protein